MEETLVHYICRLPEEDDCIKLSTYSIIAMEAFKNSNIENILLSKTRIIEQSAFENCKELKFIAWGNEDSLKDNNYQIMYKLYKNFVDGFVTVEVSFENNCRINKKNNDNNSEIDQSPVLIQNSAFKGCEKLETVIFPKNPCVIEKDAFAHCRSLRTVVLPGGETEIYDDPFIGCKDLTIVCKKGDNKLCAFARAHNFRIIEID